MPSFLLFLTKVIFITLGLYLIPNFSLPKFENKALYPVLISILLGCMVYSYYAIYLPFQKSTSRKVYKQLLLNDLQDGKISVFLVNLGRFSVYKDFDCCKYLKPFHNKISPKKLQKELIRILEEDE